MHNNVSRLVARTANIRAVDMDTGEVLDGVPTLLRRPSKHYSSENYLVIFQSALQALAFDRDLGLEAHRVLSYMVGTVSVNNDWRVLNHQEIANELHMKRPSVSRAIALLVEKQIVIKGARIGKGHAYSLNPDYGWRGPSNKRDEAKKDAPKLKLVHSQP